MCLELRDEAIRQLSFGHPTAAAAIRAVAPGHAARHKLSRWQTKVVARLQRYAEGAAVDFSDLRIDSGVRTEFQTSVLNACRKIPYGATSTYGELAQAARRGGAARAVGNCMAGNCVPLIIPCHRVIRAGGEIGPYSAAGGSATKRRLLQMEAAVSQQISPNARHLG
jgi:methylated-DNA-[protein]-cysteine S-methyltransferase